MQSETLFPLLFADFSEKNRKSPIVKRKQNYISKRYICDKKTKKFSQTKF